MARSIVLELQEMSSDKRYDVDDLLRKALLVATKLNLRDFREWLSLELEGYPPERDVPKYRVWPAQIFLYNNVQRRWIPMMFYETDSELRNAMLNVENKQPISTLVELARKDSPFYNIMLTPAEERLIMAGQGHFPMTPEKRVSRGSVVQAIEGVRSMILEWSLRLEQEGILGEDLSFSPEEKSKAAHSTNIHIGNFQGILGDVANSTVSQNLNMNIIQGNIESLISYFKSIGIHDDDIADLRSAISADPVPSGKQLGPAVSGWIGNITAKAASGVYNIALGTIGSLIANALWVYYGQ